MGNTASVEAPRKGSRATQKLSKPRTGNPATAGLLSPGSVADIIRRAPSTAGRRSSVPSNSTPIPSPRHPESENTALDDDVVVSHTDPAFVGDSSSHPLFQPSSQGALLSGSQSIGVVPSSSRGRCMSRADLTYTGVDEGYNQAQLGLAENLPRNVSQSSMNYDLSFYEAQRLLSLADPPLFGDQSAVPEGLLQGALSRRQSYTPSYHPSHSDVTTLLPRTNSDTSLYTPMRRRSFMTPGLATRPAPVDLNVPPSIQTRQNLDESPRCGSLESTGVEFLSIPHMFEHSLMPRAHTPCETDYKQTGAFKHGTLRITNGSPARTPARETAVGGRSVNCSPTRMLQSDYFDAGSQIQETRNADDHSSVPPCITTTSPTTLANGLTTVADEHEAAISFLPELTLTISPFSFGEVEQESLELQITSKHTAIEDQLFEEGSPEYGAEILDVRLDDNAKPRSSPPTTSSDVVKRKEIDRSDSGIVASPTSSVPHKSLSKADSGYSSSVSIRTLSSKRNEQQDVEGLHTFEAGSPKASASQSAKLLSNISTRPCSATVAPELQPQTPSSDSRPPLVPEKDHIRTTKLSALPGDFQNKTGSLSNRISPAEISKPALHSALRPDNHSTPASTLTISNVRKPGKLQRLLSSARAPLTVHITHVEDRDASIPPVPRAVQEKLHEHAKLPPDAESSLEAIGVQESNPKITAVSKTSTAHEHDPAIRAPREYGSSARAGRDKARSFKSSLNLHSLGSTITRAASSVMKNPMLRMPTLARTKTNDTEHADEISEWQPRALGSMDTIPLAATGGREQYGGLAVTGGRSNSLSAFIGNSNPKIHDEARRSSLASQSEYHANSFLRPSYPGQYLPSRTPPPISMKTRNIGPLRVPPPIRPRSTPPVKPEQPMLSRKSSREGIHSYPPYHYPTSSSHAGVSGRSGQENLYTFTGAQIQAFLDQHSQMSGITVAPPSSVQSPVGEYWAPSGIPNQAHSAAPSRETSFDHSRRNSMTSQNSQRSTLSNRQPWPQYPPYDTPTLRHRSSYDGHTFQTRPSHGQDNRPYPSQAHGNGQMYVNNTLNNQPTLHQPSHYQQHPRYPSRGHLRHHSLDQYGSPVPYRVLHSYNSPAYRGVPIWSG